MNVSIRKFTESDIENKVKWINNPANNRFLHYELPLEVEKTRLWFEANKNNENRYDAIIEVDGLPIGLIGLLSIDSKNRKAEYYVTIGERNYIGKGAASQATKLLLEYAFTEIGLNRIYLYTEIQNEAAVRLYERVGFKREGILQKDVFSKGRFVDRYIYSITKSDFNHYYDTPIHYIDIMNDNDLYIKREDFIPFSFGGNKARKANLFFEEIDAGGYNCIVTYGSSSSNHCRVIANMTAAREIKCVIISPEETQKESHNQKLMKLFGAEIIICPITEVSETIDKTLARLKSEGFLPYFIPGGGHGNIGTQAYLDCYEEIRRFEIENNVYFDYIFHASGTGTTQAGLVCGQLINRDDREIVGISIARKNPRGRDVVVNSIKEYLVDRNVDISDAVIEKTTHFIDSYIEDGYGLYSDNIQRTIEGVMKKRGIPLDATYTGKAFAGMMQYLKSESIKDKNILFIHTGGTPLYFDSL